MAKKKKPRPGHFYEYPARHPAPFFEGRSDKPWVVVGKGPSIKEALKINREKHYFLGINDACKFIQCHATIFIDSEPMWRCAGAESPKIIVPKYMHKDELPMNEPITSLVPDEIHKKMYVFEKTVDCNYLYNTSEAAFELIGKFCDPIVVYSAGIDGGESCYPMFNSLYRKHPELGYDRQMAELEKKAEMYGFKWERL